MGHLKRSCVVGSLVCHILILVMLILGPVLLAKREEKIKVIDLVPSDMIDKLLAPPAPARCARSPSPRRSAPEEARRASFSDQSTLKIQNCTKNSLKHISTD